MVAVASLCRPPPGNPFLTRKSRPLVVGHRGVPTLHQENTLAGFRRAVALGIDAIELDVRITRDRRAVVFHDASAARLTGVRRKIADLTWDEVAPLRIRRTARHGREERIPLLAEVLSELGHRIAINIELKPRWCNDDSAAIVAAEIAAAGVEHRVLVTSYDPRELRDMARIAPAVALGYIWGHSLLGAGRRVLGAHVAAVGADHPLVGEASVGRLRRAGAAVGAHVVFPIDGRPTPDAEIDRLRGLGLDWIEADDPERLQRLIA